MGRARFVGMGRGQAAGRGANPVDKPGYALECAEGFETTGLDPRKWSPFYLPHWSSRQRAEPRYQLSRGRLVLRIEPDQPPWCPEFDPGVKVSAVQTGQFSGPLGARVGQHRFAKRMVVRQEQPEARLYVPQYGFFEMRAKADISTNNLVSLFMIGFEETPRNSGEITIMEIFGRHVAAGRTRLGHGIKPINDPRLSLEFFEDELAFNVADWHVYAAEWTPVGVDFYFDNTLLHHVGQTPRYPMQFILGVYELPGIKAPARQTPASFTIDYFRGYRRSGAGGPVT